MQRIYKPTRSETPPADGMLQIRELLPCSLSGENKSLKSLTGEVTQDWVDFLQGMAKRAWKALTQFSSFDLRHKVSNRFTSWDWTKQLFGPTDLLGST